MRILHSVPFLIPSVPDPRIHFCFMIAPRFRGYLLAALAAAAYGTNPAFALPLYSQGMDPVSVLFFRYIIGLPFLAIAMKLRNVSFRLSPGEIGFTAILGILMALSSLALFDSYNYMNSGIASTLLFIYPVMVAVMMTFFFHERFSPTIGICLLLMAAGLFLLIRPDSAGDSLSTVGVLLVIFSALTYALYIILVNVSSTVRAIPTSRLLFYVLSWGSLLYLVIISVSSVGFALPARPSGWLSLTALAVIPTVISLACTTRAIQLIGSTPTAIFGALEPVTAVVLSVWFLHQSISSVEIVGGFLIVIATTLVIADHSVDRFLLHVRRFFPRIRHHK